MTPSTCLGCGAWMERARLGVRVNDLDQRDWEIQYEPQRFHDYECLASWATKRHEAEQKARLAEAAK